AGSAARLAPRHRDLLAPVRDRHPDRESRPDDGGRRRPRERGDLDHREGAARPRTGAAVARGREAPARVAAGAPVPHGPGSVALAGEPRAAPADGGAEHLPHGAAARAALRDGPEPAPVPARHDHGVPRREGRHRICGGPRRARRERRPEALRRSTALPASPGRGGGGRIGDRAQEARGKMKHLALSLLALASTLTAQQWPFNIEPFTGSGAVHDVVPDPVTGEPLLVAGVLTP